MAITPEQQRFIDAMERVRPLVAKVSELMHGYTVGDATLFSCMLVLYCVEQSAPRGNLEGAIQLLRQLDKVGKAGEAILANQEGN